MYCHSTTHPTGQPSISTVRIAFPSSISSLDPLSENTLISISIENNIYDSLINQNAEYQFKPSLALRWSNTNDTTWIFELRHNVTFHDGSPFTADDVLFTFDRIRESASAQQSSSLTVIDRVEAIDPYTVRLVTHEPCSNLLSRIAGVLICPRKSFAAGAQVVFPGTGPYRVRSWEPKKYVDLETCDQYWGQKPPIKNLRFEAVRSVEESAKRLILGELEILPQLDPASLKTLDLASSKEIVIRNYPGLMVIYLSFNTKDRKLPNSNAAGNPFQDRRVRKAVYHAIDVGELVDRVQKGYATEATQLVAPSVYGYNAKIQRFSHDPAEARRLLAEAGYPQGFSVRLDLPNNRYRSLVEVGESIARHLAEVGIHVELNAKPLEEWMQIREQGRAAMYLAGWTLPSGDAIGALDYLIHTPENTFGYGRANSGGYSNPDIDRVIEESRMELDSKKRKKMLEMALAMAAEDVAGVPLYVEQNLVAYRSSLHWEPSPSGIISGYRIRPAAP